VGVAPIILIQASEMPVKVEIADCTCPQYIRRTFYEKLEDWTRKRSDEKGEICLHLPDPAPLRAEHLRLRAAGG
jgi:hypothetical protein